jgi:hypothetical protein
VGTATEAALAPTRWVPGSVVSRDDARIASAAAGRVIEIVEVGTSVRAGQRLAKLDDAACVCAWPRRARWPHGHRRNANWPRASRPA